MVDKTHLAKAMPVRFLQFYPQFKQANTLKNASGISKENELDISEEIGGVSEDQDSEVKIEFQF